MTKVKDHEHLIRDPETKMIKNKNKNAFEAARARKRAVLEKKERENELEERVDSLESKLDAILDLLTKGQSNE